MRLVIALLASAALGATTAAADEAAGGLSQTGATRALSMALNAGSTWAIWAIAVGWWLRRPLSSAAGATVCLAMATGSYYLGGVEFGDRADLGLSAVMGAGSMWMVIACVLGPILGLVGVLARSSAAVGAAACCAPLVGMAAELVWRRQLNGRTFVVDPWIGWTQVAMLGAAAGVSAGLLLLRRSPPRLSRRLRLPY